MRSALTEERVGALMERLAAYARALDLDADLVAGGLAVELDHAARAADLRAVPEVDHAALARAGAPAQPRDPAAVMPWLQGEALWARMRATAVPITEAARRLGVSDSALRRVLGTVTGDGVELVGVKDARGAWRLFAYQLPDPGGRGGEPATRGGRRVQGALPPGMHPVALQAWWDRPDAALYLDGAELTPREWLARDLDPDRVIDAARREDAA